MLYLLISNAPVGLALLVHAVCLLLLPASVMLLHTETAGRRFET